MMRKTLFALTIAALVPCALAAPGPGRPGGPGGPGHGPGPGGPHAPPVTVEEVGDADSFGRNVTWLGLLSGTLRLASDCGAFPGDPTACMTIAAAPAYTTFDLPELDTLSLPGRSTKSILCHTQTPVVSWFASNAAAGPQDFEFRVTPYYVFHSAVLDGPSDPYTGVPYGGRIELALTGIYTGRTMQAGDSAHDVETGTRACIGGLVTHRSLMQQWGLTEAQADRFFREPVTITIGIRGQARLVDDAHITIGTRFFGD